MISSLKYLVGKLRHLSYFLDVIFFPVTAIALSWFRLIKFHGLKHYPIAHKLFNFIGAYPIVKHYYEPRFDFEKYSAKRRELKGLDLDTNKQLEMLSSFRYHEELKMLPEVPSEDLSFYHNNGSFSYADAECYYSMIRTLRPKRIIEIGSGFSTRIALSAIQQNQSLHNYTVELVCIEPYEMNWLSELDIQLVRKKVEDVDPDVFRTLKKGDILFIDSSHVIRPEGDVLHEILNILPILEPGVYIHFHDIFTPWDYPKSWLHNEGRLWNEQYLLEGFMSFNKSFETVLALSFLFDENKEALKKVFPAFSNVPGWRPGSFWIRRSD